MLPQARYLVDSGQGIVNKTDKLSTMHHALSTSRSPDHCGIYLYCITMAGPAQEFGPIGIGGRGDPLYTIAADGL
ncbi:MAG: hypothetical protein WCP58_05675, partial [bacterium]